MNRAPDGVAVDLLFAARPFTGLEHHALHTLRGLRLAGASVDVWTPQNILADMGDAAQGHRLVAFSPVPRPLRLGREQWAIPWRFGVHPRGYRVMHCISGVAPLLTRIPLVLSVPDLTFRVFPRDLHPKARLYFGFLVPRSIRLARRIIVSSEAIRRQVIDLYHIAPERVHRVPLCADAIFTPRPGPEVLAVRKQYGLPERYILCVATVDVRKDLGRLRAAYDLLPADMLDTALVVAGRTNPGSERLARELTRPSRRGHVIGLGYVPRDALPALYSGASAFVYPSRYEGFGLPVLEAMSCGSPVIVSASAALAELVGEAGVVLRTESVEELTRALERLLRFEDERRRQAQLALERAAEFSVGRLGAETVDVYEQALQA